MSTATDDAWQKILEQLDLPSARMLLSQQAKIAIVTEEEIVVVVTRAWVGMIQSRTSLIQQAVDRVFPGKNVVIHGHD